MPIMVQKNKWILYKHTCDYELIKAVALDVKNSCNTELSDFQKHQMQERLKSLNLYKARNTETKPLDAINHRINTLEYWMFGYEDKINEKKRFMFSPLGNLFLKYIDDSNKQKFIFTAMMFAMQFQHPGSSTNIEFQLYPFRLIFKLLLDERLEYKLFNNEVEYLVVFEKEMSEEKYEQLVKRILELRKKTTNEMAKLFKEDEHTFVNAVHEWEYFTQKLLSTIGIINRYDGETICKLFHPTKTNSHSKPTARTATNGYITINDDIKNFVFKMLNKYSFDQRPLRLDDPERLRVDVIKEIYNFYPEELLIEINEDNLLSDLLELPKLIESYSNNPDNETAYLFEDVLTDGFNMFYNVKAQKIGGAGHTDIECLYITRKRKFAVECKSTSNKLLGINVGRLREHRNEINANYTIVITSRYVPAAKRDIFGTDNVIILASTFAEFLYNHIFNDIREIDYEDFDNIIMNNLGKDVSQLISNITVNKFAANS